MRIRTFIRAAICLLILTAAGLAQSSPVQITGGRFFIRGLSSGEEANNATIETGSFLAAGTLGGGYSPWSDICRSTPTSCAFGQTITVPSYPQIALGGCIGDCRQFISGPFTIDGTTYQNAFYRGSLTFSRETFFIPKTTRRKGKMTFKSPFTLTGRLQVCEVSTVNSDCPADKILFDGALAGHGTLTVLMSVKITDAARPYPYPYLSQDGFEYVFER